MSRNRLTERSDRIRVSTIPNSERVRKIKSFSLSTGINVVQVRRFRSFAKNPVVRERDSTNEQPKSHRSRHAIHAEIHHSDTFKESPKTNQVQPLAEESESTKTESVRAMRVSHHQSQERERSNDLPTTAIDTEAKLTHGDSFIQQQTQQETVDQGILCKDDWVDRGNENLFPGSNHQDFKALANTDNGMNALSRHNEPIPNFQSDRSKKILRKQKKQGKRRRYAQYGCRCCSSRCAVISVFTTLLLLAGLTALLMALLHENKTTTTLTTTTIMTAVTSPTATTSTTTTSTTSSLTTASTTTSSSTTTSTTTSTSTATSTTSSTSTTTSASTTSTTTTSSTATTSTTTTSRTTTSSATTTSTTTTSTTTTAYNCGQSCLNQSWSNSSSVLALWSFDGSYADGTNVYNALPSTNPPAFVTGYFGQAASFNASSKQALHTPFIPLNNVSFTVQVWVRPTAYSNTSTDSHIVGLCPIVNSSACLHILIRSQKFYFGFYSNDLSGVALIPLNQWTHGAFVYDAVKKTQTIYVNGFQDNQRTAPSALLVSSGNFTIATNEHISSSTGYLQGYIDQLSINQRAKSSCEVLEEATLAAYFTFDTSSPYNNSGPNPVDTTASSTSTVSGYLGQAVAFNGSSSSYFQTWGFTSFGISNQTFSIAFWILPQALTGTLVHLSPSSSGTGSTCFPLLGFDSNGAIVAQVLTSGASVVTATGPVLPVSLSWIPIVQTWSSTNGLRLYVNNTLISSIAVSTFVGSGTTPNYVTLGGCLNGCGVCANGSVDAPGPFEGAIDDWRIYTRELTAIDVCTLANTV